MDQAQHWHIIEKENNRKGAVTSAVIHGLLLLLLFLLMVPNPKEEDMIEGVLIDFGDSRSGLGQDIRPVAENQTEARESAAASAQPASSPETSPAVADEVVTQDVVEAPAITPEKTAAQIAAEKRAAEKAAREKAEAEAREKAAAEKAAKEKAAQEHKDKLDQVWQNSGGDGSQGSTTPGGDQGSPSGTPGGGPDDGSGMGEGGIGHNLSGRKMVRAPSIDDSSQKTGTVAIRVRVDRTGKVISAEFTSKGSTTTDMYLVKKAEQAALQAKFNSDPSANAEQVGTIFFTFKVR